MTDFPAPPPSPQWATNVAGRYSGQFKFHKTESLAKSAIDSSYGRREWQLLHWNGNGWDEVYSGIGKERVW